MGHGRWTMEFMCKLDTGHTDATVFETNKTYAIVVAVRDRTGAMDKASSVICLEFEIKIRRRATCLLEARLIEVSVVSGALHCRAHSISVDISRNSLVG